MSGEGVAVPRQRRSALRKMVSELARFDTSAVAPVAGLRVAIGVVAALCIGTGLGNDGLAASMASGALLVGLAAVVAGRHAPVTGLLAVDLAMGVTTFAGSATGRLGWVHTAVLAAACLASGLLLALGQVATSVGTQGIAAMIVFGRFAEPPLGAFHLAVYVVAGGTLAVLVVVLTRPPLTERAQRQALAIGYQALADLARRYQGGAATMSAATAFESAEALLARRIDPGPAGGGNLRALLDVGRRARLELLAIDGLRLRLPEGVAGGGARADVEAALGPAAAALDAIAESLDQGSSPAGQALTDAADASRSAREHIRERYRGQGETIEPPLDIETQVAAVAGEHVAALGGQIRAAADLAAGSSGTPFDLRAVVSGVRLPPRPTVLRQSAQDAWDTLADQATLRSPIGRHAVRLAAAVAIAETIALHTPLARGYWVALTVAVVLRPDFSVTFTRGAARMAGTSVGVLLAGLLAVAIHPSGAAEIVVVGVICATACASFRVSYLLFSALLTGLVVMLVGYVSPGTVSTAFDRLVDTLIGGGLALVAYAAWPTWSASTAPEAFAGLAATQRDYLEEVLGVATGGRTLDPQRLRALAKRARRARADADSVVERSTAEPAGRRIDVLRSRGIIAALQRVSFTCHALRTDLEAGRLSGPFPQAAALAAALVEALGSIADHLTAETTGDGPGWHVRAHLPAVPLLHVLTTRRQSQVHEGPVASEVEFGPCRVTGRDLRALHEEVAAAVATEPDGGLLVVETDELVDAVDTLGEGFGLYGGSGRTAM